MKSHQKNADIRLVFTDNWINTNKETDIWKRACGCIKTSDKLKQMLLSFPAPPPPTNINSTLVPALPANGDAVSCHVRLQNPLKQILLSFPVPPPLTNIGTLVPALSANGDAKLPPADHPPTCISSYCKHQSAVPETVKTPITMDKAALAKPQVRASGKPYRIVSDLVSLVQLSVTATALALYYLLYCYMQVVYYTLRSALYFHNADGPMKITIGVVAFTSLLIGFNVLLRMERMAGILS